MAFGSHLSLFHLYGEAHRPVHGDFVHVETLDDRSRPSEWSIRPHRHAELNHVFHVATGGGVLIVEGREIVLSVPALVVVPASTVHGFRWESESTGAVVTLATAHYRRLVDLYPDLGDVFAEAGQAPIAGPDADRISRCMDAIRLEYALARPGHRAAIDAGVVELLVAALRGVNRAAPGRHTHPGPQHALAARLRERIEHRFRLREPVETYAAALSVTPSQLRAACVAVTGVGPAALLDQRTILEARRGLLYSALSIKALAFSLGFEDPAYFSRFFARHVGRPARAFRYAGRGER